MLTLISPAKTLDLSTSTLPLQSQPDFKDQTKELVSVMRKKNVQDLMDLMHISENLAVLNHERYLNFQEKYEFPSSKQALLAFKGDVYTKIDVDQYTEEDFEFAQAHLRILSGLYGLLKPLDLIQPYRLEMGISLKTEKGKNLYEFWGDRIAKAINEASVGKTVVNLASQEYFKSVNTSVLQVPVVTPTFKEFRNGKYQVVGLFAKQARGMMTNYIIKNKIDDPEQLKVFNEANYELKEITDANEWVFVR